MNIIFGSILALTRKPLFIDGVLTGMISITTALFCFSIQTPKTSDLDNNLSDF